MDNKHFKREHRYVVLKTADMAALSPKDKQELYRISEILDQARGEAGKRMLQCLVIESDWPEYEPTWDAIETRILGF
jgi:hypothetical protein